MTIASTTKREIPQLNPNNHRYNLAYHILCAIDYVLYKTMQHAIPRQPKTVPAQYICNPNIKNPYIGKATEKLYRETNLLNDQHHKIRELWIDPKLENPNQQYNANEERFMLNPLIWYIYNHRPQLIDKYNRSGRYPSVRRIPTAHSPDSSQYKDYNKEHGHQTTSMKRKRYNNNEIYGKNASLSKWFYRLTDTIHSVDMYITPDPTTLLETFDRTNPLSVPRYFYHPMLIDWLLTPQDFITVLGTISDDLFQLVREEHLNFNRKHNAPVPTTTPSEWQASEDTEDLSSF